MEAIYLRTKKAIWEKLTRFWIRVFALTFALGVATGIPLEFSLGTNWARFSRFVGDVTGSLLGAEGFFAFAIEAGFLGVLLFGWKKVSPKMHFLSAVMVAFGAHFSAIWIVSLNSWMQTPAGFELVTQSDGTVVAQVTSWLEMFFNPSNVSHLIHVIMGTWMTGAFLILSISSYYLLKNRYEEFARCSFQVGLIIALIATPLQLVFADHLARKVAHYNPEKFASLEGVFRTKSYTPVYLFGWVNPKEEKVYGVKIPGALSFLVYRDWEKPVRGLDQFPKDQRPYVPAVFQMYHIMVIMWVLMFFGCLAGLYLWRKKAWSRSPKLLWFLILSVLFPQFANIAGWFTAEMGRQPWTVYKLLKTNDAYSAVVTRGEVISSLVMFVVLYLMMFALFLFLLDRKIKQGPEKEEEELPYRDVFKNK